MADDIWQTMAYAYLEEREYYRSADDGDIPDMYDPVAVVKALPEEDFAAARAECKALVEHLKKTCPDISDFNEDQLYSIAEVLAAVDEGQPFVGLEDEKDGFEDVVPDKDIRRLNAAIRHFANNYEPGQAMDAEAGRQGQGAAPR